MSLKNLSSEIKHKNIKIIFVDYFDTIVHRNMHPNYALRLWAKLMIRELGLEISIDELYFIRLECVKYLSRKLNRNSSELPYKIVIEEIYHRLLTIAIIKNTDKIGFKGLFEKIDLRVETNVQYVNKDVVNFLKEFKKTGGKVYLVSDFFLPKSIFAKLLEHHNLSDIFDDIYSSASVGKSKESGTIYNHLISQLSLKPNEVMMIGDNEKNDVINSKKNGLHSFLLPHAQYIRRNNRNRLGNDFRNLKKIIDRIHNNCKKNASVPYTEYILFYHFFIERLYNKAKKEHIKDLFFLSREGLYLKKLFDSYQDYVNVGETTKIKSHYLKISRQASLQINLKNLIIEEFIYLQKNVPTISLYSFLSHFNCPEKTKIDITKDLNIDGNLNIENFFTSDEYIKLKSNNIFISFYNNHRAINHSEFKKYIDSFGTNVIDDGIHLVDIGWRGTMQEAIFVFFNEKITVTGYYLGLREISDMKEKTKRYGLLFSILPYISYNDHLLLANTQLYEQFSAADHGSVVCYTSESEGYVVELFKTEEKTLYDNYIREHQEQMFKFHLELSNDLENVCYDQNMVQEVLSEKALVTGLFLNSKKLKFINVLSAGFIQNIGANNVGITYQIKKNTAFQYWKLFLLTPEVMFRELTKLKPVLFKKNKLLAHLVPSYIIYAYYKFNKYFRFNVLNRHALLKYQLFKNHKKL